MNETEYLMKNYGDRGGCYPLRPYNALIFKFVWLINSLKVIVHLIILKTHTTKHSTITCTVLIYTQYIYHSLTVCHIFYFDGKHQLPAYSINRNQLLLSKARVVT